MGLRPRCKQKLKAMCLYPRIIRNPATKPNKKNQGTPIPRKDPRHNSVPIGCGQCKECLAQKGRWWATRLSEEVKRTKTQGYMVTLTFSDEELREIEESIKKKRDGERPSDKEVAKKAMRMFTERWRKKYKKPPKRWFTTEHGHEGSERLHLHGVIFTDINIRAGHKNGATVNDRITTNKGAETGITSTTCKLAQIWQYGMVHIGAYCSERTINYIAKYVTKRDDAHPGWVATILTSPGLGAEYTKDPQVKAFHKFAGTRTNTHYRTNGGQRRGLPTYYRLKLWNEEERAELWTIMLDKNERWVDGERIDISKGEEPYYEALEQAQKRARARGWPEPKWSKTEYKASRDEAGLTIKQANPTNTTWNVPEEWLTVSVPWVIYDSERDGTIFKAPF